MHPDLVLIVDLWEKDRQVDDAKSRAAELKSVVTRTEIEIEGKTLELSDAVEKIGALVAKEAAVQSELDKYLMRTQRTRDLLDGHKAVDFLTVEKQLEQCEARVEALEDELLELMGQREVIQNNAELMESERERLREQKGVAHAQWVNEGRGIRSQLEEIWPERQTAASRLNRELTKRYDGFRDRKLVPVAFIDGKFCSACHVSVQDQMRLEVQSGRRIHTCRGCGRWLLPTSEDDSEVAEPGKGE